MLATIEIEESVITASLLNKAIKDERIYKSQIIIGQADGTLVYRDPSGHLHVVHGTGPQAQDLLGQAERAVRQITQGVEALAALGAKMP